jgi:hypothetical protein
MFNKILAIIGALFTYGVFSELSKRILPFIETFILNIFGVELTERLLINIDSTNNILVLVIGFIAGRIMYKLIIKKEDER